MGLTFTYHSRAAGVEQGVRAVYPQDLDKCEVRIQGDLSTEFSDAIHSHRWIQLGFDAADTLSGVEVQPDGPSASAAHTLGAADPEAIDDWAELFQALSDTNRLRILLAVHHRPGISVTDLADAVGMTANATSHALAALRVRGIVRGERSGRQRRWTIASDEIHTLLHQVGATHSPLHPEH